MFTHRIDEHTELRLLEERHAALLYALIDRNREHLRQWLPWVDASRSADGQRDFIRGALQRFAANDGLNAAIWHRGELAGVIGLHAINWPNRSTSIGYWLAASFQGKGVMTAACRALIDHALGELGLNRVEIRCATGNRRSRAIPERLGFTQEGTLRQAEWLYDRYEDLVLYSMLASEWGDGTSADAD
ncbi:MAG: GNAT family N-acetyltransferase [Longimicrobiaceae bacterium]